MSVLPFFCCRCDFQNYHTDLIIKNNSWLTSCFEDKGNYDYVEVDEIKIEGIPAEIEVLGYVENIQVSPTLTTADGEIAPDDPNYTFQYRLGYKGMGALGENHETWVDITPESGITPRHPARRRIQLLRCGL